MIVPVYWNIRPGRGIQILFAVKFFGGAGGASVGVKVGVGVGGGVGEGGMAYSCRGATLPLTVA